jgi:hypothetical protein
MSPDLGVVDNVRVSVAFAHAADGPPAELFTLDHRRGATAAPGTWDERYVELLDDVLSGPAASPYWIAVTRCHSTWASHPARAEISLRIGLPATRRTADAASVQAVLAAFRDMLGDGPAGPTSQPSRSEAVAAARRVVATAWGDSPAGDLALTEEEHHPVERLWRISLVGPDGIQYRVEVGIVDGNPAAVHARRIAAAEIVDSVGTT